MANKLPLTFPLSFCKEMIPGKGEDCECHSFTDEMGLVGAFDGCGGSGGRTHAWYSRKTEAYMASRLVAGAFYDCFRYWAENMDNPEQFARDILWPTAVQQLKNHQPPEDPTAIRIGGSMIRCLPSTAAVALLRQDSNAVEVTALWAGDSRVYLLDENGLAQLTVDDATVQDPMENVYEDGILTNVFCADRPVEFRCNTLLCKPPFVIFSATDGCYGYLSSPMEFELLLLGTLLNSSCAAQWEQSLSQSIEGVAGDDHTISMAALGYDSFQALQKSLAPRYDYVWANFVAPVQDVPMDVREPRFALWEQYRPNYFRFLKNGMI